MASKYTSNYGLCQWEASDKVLRTEFNSDNAKIDAALASKASVSAVNSKADASALSALQSTVSSQGTSLALRNCRFVTGTYTGTGKYGAAAANSLSFSQKPVFICVTGVSTSQVLNLIRGQTAKLATAGSVNASVQISWGERTVSGTSRIRPLAVLALRVR